LRERILGSQGHRPDWIPPAKYVGFKNELALANGDYVIEFARFLIDSRKVTWIGTFKRAVDAVYGDRQNHSGAGVWLLDHDLVHAQALLASLRVFADTDPQDTSLDADADLFLSDFLPGYLQPSPDHPPAIQGWPFATSRFTETAIYMASDEDEAVAWEMAADQLLRATLLPPPSPAHSRALVLVRPGKAELEQGWSRVERGTLVGDLTRALPRIFESAQDQVRAAMAEVEAAIESGRHREAELRQATENRTRLEQQVAELSGETDRLRSELQASDPNRERATLHEAVRELSQQLAGVKTSLNTVKADLLEEISNVRRRLESNKPSSASPVAANEVRGSRTAKQWKWARSPLAFAGAIALLVIAVAMFVLYWPRPAAVADPTIQVLSGPADGNQ
jgi:hypothetical protein